MGNLYLYGIPWHGHTHYHEFRGNGLYSYCHGINISLGTNFRDQYIFRTIAQFVGFWIPPFPCPQLGLHFNVESTPLCLILGQTSFPYLIVCGRTLWMIPNMVRGGELVPY